VLTSTTETEGTEKSARPEITPIAKKRKVLRSPIEIDTRMAKTKAKTNTI
jgi:hypothetical protein